MGRFSLFLFFLLTVISCNESSSYAQKNEEFFSKKTYIKSRDGFMKLGSDDWIVKNDNDQIIIGARFSSKLKSGSILRLHAVKENMNVFELRLGLANSSLSVDLRDDKGLSILSLPFADHNLNGSISGEKSIGVRLKPRTREVIYSFDNDMEMVATVNKPLDLIDSKLEVILGSDDGSSLIGCITLVSVTLSSPLANIYTIAQSDTQSCAVEGNECVGRDCGDGLCIELETPTCDCFGTGRAGANCRSDIPSARLSSSMDGTLEYLPLHGKENIRRLGLSFRLNEEEDLQGVLISASLLSKKRVTVYVVDGKGSLQIDNDLSVGFGLDNSIKDHSLVLTVEGNEITLQADGMEEKKVEVQCQEKDCVQFSEIHFGAEPQTSEVRRIGMNGCIWETYADHHNILSMYYDGHPRVSSPLKLERCNGDKEETVVDVQEQLTSFMGQSLPQVQPVAGLFDEKTSEDNIGTGASLFPPPKKEKETPSLPCNNAVGDNCRNGATCVVRNGTRLCLCPHGFTGSGCEFSSIPRTCAEARDFYRTPDGPTLIDVDGSGPLPKSVVDCKNGITTIINDMPEKTVVHDTVEQHSQFIISYRDFTPQQVAMMVVESEKCTQTVHYECARAALGFEKSKTQFSLAGSNRTVSRIGMNEKKCGHETCNCERADNGEDEGIMQSPDVGITKILAFRDHSLSNQNGQISIGPLVCSSHPGSLTPLRFSAPATVLLDRLFERDLSIQFRTTASSGVILSTDGGLFLRIKTQYSLSVSIGSMEVTVQSPIRLNNTAWHLVIIEIINNQVRLSIDGIVVVEKVEGELPPLGQIQLGDSSDGFVGCLRSLRLNNEVLDLHRETQHMENDEVHLFCPDKCHSDLCKNEAECLENLGDPTAEPVCVCKVPQIQQGANCEIDINKTPPVSFHGGHLKYEDLQWTLEGEIVLSFRTDQQQGLILFTHDHLNNFLQLHLSSEIAVTLTLNNLDEVFTCRVEAQPGEEYSDMEWVQVVISHVDNTTILSVNGRLCFIHRSRQLSTVAIKTYAHVDNEELVKIPVGLHPSTAINPFLLSYLGGVKEVVKNKGQVTLFARYDTSIPDFLGCIRGFRVGGNLIDLTHTTKGTRPDDPDLVQIGCALSCPSLTCSNGGHCGVSWSNFHPEFNNKAHCNCERTSYHGETCKEDDSVSLSNGRAVDVDIKSYLDHYPLADRTHFQILKIAFKSNGQPHTKQTIATLHFKDDSIFEVLLNRNGSVHIGSVRGDKTEVLTFAGNFSDGYRHFLVAQFKNDTGTEIVIDSTRHDLPWTTVNLDLFSALSLTLGSPSDSRFVDAQRESFDGCVSNVELDYRITAVKIAPIAELYNASTTRWSVTSLRPEGISILDMRIDSCGQFKEKDHLPGLPSKTDFPVWDTNFGRLIYTGQWLEGGEEESSFPVWIIILLVLVILAIVVLFVYLLFCKKSSPPKKLEEETPLQPVISSPIPNKPASNFTIPEPELTLPVDQVSLRSHSTTLKSEAYFTAPEFQSDEEDWDRTLTEDSIERPEELNHLPTFNRTMPHRLSSFKRSDPTVPVNSPLYVSPLDEDRSVHDRRPSPRPVPPPRITSTSAQAHQ